MYELLKRGVSVEKMHQETMIDCWFLSKILNLLNYERELAKGQLTEELYTPVSYTHLDVYKRQVVSMARSGSTWTPVCSCFASMPV